MSEATLLEVGQGLPERGIGSLGPCDTDQIALIAWIAHSLDRIATAMESKMEGYDDMEGYGDDD